MKYVESFLRRYALADQWRFSVLDFLKDAIVGIRDFRFARYALDGAEFHAL